MNGSRSISKKQIEIKAYENWQKRQSNNEEGTPEQDWENAAQQLENSKCEATEGKFKQILTKPWQLLPNIPKFVLWTLPRSEWIKLLAAPLVLSIAVSIVTSKIQKNDTFNKLNSYFDKIEDLVFEHKLLESEKDSPARIIAKSRSLTVLRNLDLNHKEIVITFLEASDLINRNNDRDGISLAYLDLEDINLYGLNLEGAEMIEANLLKANLEDTKLNNADLTFAKLNGAKLNGAELNGARLFYAELNDATLFFAKLNGAEFYLAKLNGAELNGADFSNATLDLANLSKATFRAVNFKGATLYKANLRGTDLTIAKNLTPSQIKSACFWDEAIYQENEVENQKYIEDLKKDLSANTKEKSAYCESFWSMRL